MWTDRYFKERFRKTGNENLGQLNHDVFSVRCFCFPSVLGFDSSFSLSRSFLLIVLFLCFILFRFLNVASREIVEPDLFNAGDPTTVTTG